MREPSEREAERTSPSAPSQSRERPCLPEGTAKRKKAPDALVEQQSSVAEGHSAGEGTLKARPAWCRKGLRDILDIGFVVRRGLSVGGSGS